MNGLLFVWLLWYFKSGPESWGSIGGNAICNSGISQSPINIQTAKTVPFTFPPFEFSPAYKRKIVGTYLNNGETGKIYLSSTFFVKKSLRF